MTSNALFYGDNLVWLRDHTYFPPESVDLIYLDPPFNSKSDYNVLFNEPGKGKSQAQIQAFDDTWHWDSESSAVALNELAQNKPQIAQFISWLSQQGKIHESMAAYLAMMSIRLIELQRVLKPSGSIYLHCDPTASHYIKVIMDSIFGATNFQNEIVWCFKTGGATERRFGRKHNLIFFYSKTPNYKFNPQKEKSYMMHEYGFKKSNFQIDGKGQYSWVIAKDWWEIPAVGSATKERLGYPTQKPLPLLERIIKASSNEGDVVLDPFCGCGTSIDAAHKLNRNWLGIDVTWLAIDLVEKRLKATQGSKVVNAYTVHGKPFDVASAEALANKNKKEFEIWAITLVNASPREHDGGVDGIFGFVEKDKRVKPIIVQVKGGDVLNPGMVRDLIGTVKKEKAAIGLLITLREPSPGMKSLAIHSETYHSELWNEDYPSIQIRTIAELFDGKTFHLPPMQNPYKKAKLNPQQGEQSEVFTDTR